MSEIEEVKEEEIIKEKLEELSELDKIEKEELRITKRSGIEDGQYNDIYEVRLTVSFYFDKEGVYDGLSFYTEDITEEEADLLEELVDKLAEDL